MKIPGRIFILTLLAIHPFFCLAQEEELDTFKKNLFLYLDYYSGRNRPATAPSGGLAGYRKKVDESFNKFVLHPNSHLYDKLITARDDEKTKFINLDNKGELYVATFSLGEKRYLVYGYISENKVNYVIKERESNTIVYRDEEGINPSYSIDNMYQLDDSHILVIEKNGHLSMSSSAFVLSGDKKPWKKIKAFEGKAFGQIPAEYYKKTFVKRRAEFHVVSDQLGAPLDATTITYSLATRAISYKQYKNRDRYTTVTAKWENQAFIIDDYNVNENLSSCGGGVVPY